MNWQTIETCPKNVDVVLWCAERRLLIPVGKLTDKGFCSWDISDFDGMDWVKLESYEKPTHWMQIKPPE